MRRDRELFATRGAEVLIIAPHDAATIREFWKRKDLSFTALPDPDHRLANLYGQRWGFLKRLQLPSVVVIDKNGKMRGRHDGRFMWDIPSNKDVLALLEGN